MSTQTTWRQGLAVLLVGSFVALASVIAMVVFQWSVAAAEDCGQGDWLINLRCDSAWWYLLIPLMVGLLVMVLGLLMLGGIRDQRWRDRAAVVFMAFVSAELVIGTILAAAIGGVQRPVIDRSYLADWPGWIWASSILAISAVVFLIAAVWLNADRPRRDRRWHEKESGMAANNQF